MSFSNEFDEEVRECEKANEWFYNQLDEEQQFSVIRKAYKEMKEVSE